MQGLEETIKQGERAFDKKTLLLSLWQTIAENFYPERANFTGSINPGSEHGDGLMSSYPVLARRDLGDAISSMLRPTSKDWFSIRTIDGWDELSVEGKVWLEKAQKTQKRLMYNRESQFVRATKEADHDFITFGQGVIQSSLNKDATGLLYRCWHLRDVAWLEDENGAIVSVFRKWRATMRDLMQKFPNTVHRTVKEKFEKDPYTEVDVWHCVLPTDLYPSSKKLNTPWVSLYIDVANKHLMEEVGARDLGYTIPRWRTVSGSQYGLSPATAVALADARLLQAMVAVLLEAGEKAVNPPMVANKEVFGGAFSIYAGGTTWADMAGGRIGDHFQQLPGDKNGIPLGLDMARDIRAQIAEAFFLNKLSLPPAGTQGMTAYEVGQRVQEYIRQVMPLFEPLELEYNGPLMESTFTLLLRMGAFGSPLDMPEELMGKRVQFVFESPLHDAVERAKAQRFAEAKGLLVEAQALDPSVVHSFDAKTAFLDVLSAINTPSTWIRPESEALSREEEENRLIAEQQQMAQAQQAAETVKTIGDTAL